MKNSLNILLTIGLFSSFANAHIEPGNYVGQDGDEKCYLIIESVYYNNDIKHPLNERVEVATTYSENSFTLSHLPQINIEETTVKPEKSILSAAVGTADSSEAVRLHIIHSDTFNGPGSFHYIAERTDEEGIVSKTNRLCSNLKKED